MNLTIENVSAELKGYKYLIEDDYIHEEDTLPSLDVTLAANREELVSGKKVSDWTIQLGDNSFSGSAYFYNTWEVGNLYRRTNSRELAKELINGLYNQAYS